MADEEKTEEESTEEAAVAEPKAGSKKKLFMIIGGVVLLLVAIGAPVAFFALSGGAEEEVMLDEDAAQVEEQPQLEGFQDEDEWDEDETPLGAIFPMETFVVNLADESYIRSQVQVEFVDRTVPRRFHLRQVPIRDALIDYFASRTREDVVSAKRREEMKDDIKETINTILRRELVRQVYFTQFVVQ